MGDPNRDRRNARRRHDVLEIPIAWVAFALSLLVHVGVLWLWLPSLLDRTANARFGDGSRQLVADLRPAAPPSAPAPAPPPIPAPVITAPVEPPTPAAPPRAMAPPPKRAAAPRQPIVRAAPPPIVADRAPAVVPLPAPAPPVVPEPKRPEPAVAEAPRERDLSAYIESRRRARGDSSTVVSEGERASARAPETDIERRDRIVASNLGLNRTPSFGYDPQRAGGMFQITSLEYDYADFWFFGLNKAINRNTKQKIVVRKGDASDIRVAVARKMIAIIRDHVAEDFVWISRQGPVTMSARPGEGHALEAFIVRDVFPDFGN